MKRRTENGKLKTENGLFSVLPPFRSVSPSGFRFPFSVFLLLLLLTVACTSKRKTVSPMVHAKDYTWMSAKVNGELSMENGENVRFTGLLRMYRDSTVWLSVSAFMGVENARILVTNDSVMMLNRVNQTYLAEPISSLMETHQVPSLQELQSLLLGNGSSEHVELQWVPYTAKIQYEDIHWDEPTTFPMKINKKYERVKL